MTEFITANPAVAHLLNSVATIVLYYQANKRIPFLNKGNGSGWNGEDRRYRKLGECELLHEGISKILDDGKERMGRIENKLDKYTERVTKALTIVEEHTKNKQGT